MSIEIPVVCAIISSTCSLIWIANQICWYRIFKNHFLKQQKHLELQERILNIHMRHISREKDKKIN
jgi:hypothetical protein